jgi:S-formylglutathione hydrolase FrmB
MKKHFILLALITLSFSAFAGIDTISIYSNSMFKHVKCVVVTPAAYKKAGPAFPVVYLLHGYSGKYSDWVMKDPEMQQLADENNMIIVCPDGAFSSWYFDSPVDLTMHYETNVSSEIPAYIDSVYHTIKNRNARAITGLSMGGHGGLFLAFRHADIFGACGSMSGALDVNGIKTRYEIGKRLGDTNVNKQIYVDWSVVNVIEKYPKDSIAITFDCGVEDGFITANRQVHNKMLDLKIPHNYTERPGKHDWDYWTEAVKFQLLFFREYFAKTKP